MLLGCHFVPEKKKQNKKNVEAADPWPPVHFVFASEE